MAGDVESAGKPRVGVELASLEFEDLPTAVAAEVVMVSLAGDLISQGFAGHGDCCKPVILQQRADVAIYGRNAKTFYLSLRSV